MITPNIFDGFGQPKGPSLLFEVAIVELDSLGKPTGRFTVSNHIAPDAETAKLKAYATSDVATTLPALSSVKVSVRGF